MDMKTSIKKINGKEYLYATDSIYVAKGKTIQKNKSLGPAATMKNTARKKQLFYQFLLKEETIERTKYWETKTDNPAFQKWVSVQTLEQLRSKLFRAKKNMGEIATAAMETAFLIDFIYNSNKIEGSKIPKDRVTEIVQEEKSGNDEVNNTMKAIGYIETKFRFEKKQIEKLHSILLAHEPKKTKFRKEKVVVGNEDVAAWENIPGELQKLLEWYQKMNHKIYPPELAFTFYYRFERIHPFLDGNGRIGRLLMNKILNDHKYHPIIIWNRQWKRHLSAFKKYMEGKPEYYFKFMADQFQTTHELYIDKIEQALNLEKLTHNFTHPSSYNFE